VKADVTEAGCNNYFHSSSGKNVTQMPMDAVQFYVAAKLLPRLGWRVERRSPRRAQTGGSGGDGQPGTPSSSCTPVELRIPDTTR
jgi:hypothetical protein